MRVMSVLHGGGGCKIGGGSFGRNLGSIEEEEERLICQKVSVKCRCLS